MWRSVKVHGILSDTANLCWSKDNVMAQAIREVAGDAANDPRKCPVKRESRQQKSPPIRLNASDSGAMSNQPKAENGWVTENGPQLARWSITTWTSPRPRPQ